MHKTSLNNTLKRRYKKLKTSLKLANKNNKSRKKLKKNLLKAMKWVKLRHKQGQPCIKYKNIAKMTQDYQLWLKHLLKTSILAHKSKHSSTKKVSPKALMNYSNLKTVCKIHRWPSSWSIVPIIFTISKALLTINGFIK